MMRINQNPRTQTVRQPIQQESPCLTPPLPLVAILRDNPLALGLLCLIKRLYLIHKRPIPLSAADIACYDPLASPSAARRAIERLISAGGVVAYKSKGGKQAFVPAWGMVGGKVRVWDASCKLYNRPSHQAVVRLDARIFDYFLGRLTPDGRLAVMVDRYVTAPLLSLGDVGAYLALQGGFAIKPGQMDQLARCGLIRDGKPCPLPARGDDILRWISQRQLFQDGAPTLAAKGLRRLGIGSDEPAPAPEFTGQALVYIPPGQPVEILPPEPERSGESSGNRSGLEGLKTAQEMRDLSSPGADELQRASEPSDMTWNLKHLNHDPTLPSQVAGLTQKPTKQRKKRTTDPLPTTPTAMLLKSLGTRPSVIRELCHIEIDQANKILDYGRSRPDVRSLAGWIVNALRDHRDQGWLPPAPPKPNPELFDAEKHAASEYASLFARCEETPTSAIAEDSPALRHLAEPAVLMEWLRETLGRLFQREDRELVGRLRLLDAGDVPLFSCASPEDMLRLEDGLAPYVRNVCRDFGWEQPPQFVLANPDQDTWAA